MYIQKQQLLIDAKINFLLILQAENNYFPFTVILIKHIHIMVSRHPRYISKMIPCENT